MYRRLSDSSDDSSASDNSSELPPSFNCDGNQEENFRWKLKILKIGIKEMNSEFNNKLPTLTGQIKELQNITDELESMHKKITVGSLRGAVLGAAGGITSIAGLCLAPFTFGASLGLISVGTGVGIAGGATGAAYTITNMIKPKKLCETIETIIKDVQNTIKSMIEQLSAIKDKIEDIEQLEKTMKQIGDTTATCSTNISELNIIIDNMLSQAVKDVLVFGVGYALIDAAEAAYVAAQAAKAARVSAQAAKAARVSGDVAKFARVSVRAAKAARVSADAVKVARVAGAASGIFSALFVVLDVVSIVQYSTEISEINQSADNRNKENIKSDTLQFIHQARQRAAVFQKTLGNIECLRKTINQEFNKMLQSSTSSQAKPRGRIINKDNMFINTL